jgi:Zn-dependent protease with chaperone function
MDFFASQDAARRQTSLLLFYFGLAVFFIIVAIYMAITFVFIYYDGKTGQLDPAGRLWNMDLFVAVTSITLLVVLAGSLYKIAVLKAGGARVAEMLGGRPVLPNSNDFLEKRLLNVVEEIAIASGVPVPPVYVMDQEKGINAFAAGFSPDDAVIGITRGALEILNREEIQGVIAHEFSHILNGDMRLDLKLVGFLHGILLIALIGRSILHGSSRSRNSKNSGGAVIFGLILLILGYIGVLFGKLIKSAVSRQREFLADASAVQFTRNPFGLAGALKKIGGLAKGSLIENSRAEEISHMFFGNGMKASWASAFSTHPPLDERIMSLDPTFDGSYPKVERQKIGQDDEAPTQGKDSSAESGATTVASAAVLAILAKQSQNITKTIGAPVRAHMEKAGQLLQSLPNQLREAAHEPFGARAVIYGLLLDEEEAIRLQQMKQLEKTADPAVFAETKKLYPLLSSLAAESRLPLMDISMPALRSMSFEQFRTFEENVEILVRADEKVSLFEYSLKHVIIRRLEANYVKPHRKVMKIDSILEVAEECSCVLSLLANLGHEDNQAVQAFDHAVATFQEPRDGFHYLDRKQCQEIELDAVLEKLAAVSPKVKQSLVTACFQCLVYDKEIKLAEAELFRVVVYALDCPLPPWVKI